MAEREPKAGVDELLWPVRGVSTDGTNLTKLDGDGNVLTSTVDADARYVKKAGDTMTGNLIVERDGTTGGNSIALRVHSDTANPVINFRKTRGTLAAPVPAPVNDVLWRLNTNTIKPDGSTAGGGFVGAYCTQAPTAAGVGTGLQFVVTDISTGTTANRIMTFDHTGMLTAPNASFTTLMAPAIFSTNGVVQVQGSRLTVQAASQPVTATGETGVMLSAVCTGGNAASTNRGVNVAMTGVSLVAVGVDVQFEGEATQFNFGVRVGLMADTPQSYAYYTDSPARCYFRGKTGIGWTTPTHQLEVGGDTMLRGPLEVTGNITSTGTAHSFSSRSIPSSAVIGSTAGTVAGGLAAGTPGTMIWDENFLYLKTATAWKKIALSAI